VKKTLSLASVALIILVALVCSRNLPAADAPAAEVAIKG
jgi:hypothetical protein